jgi:methionine-rich copper-binding protein CopC
MIGRAILGVLVLSVVLAASVSAHHAELTRSEPTNGARVAGSPREVRAWFTAPLVVPGSGLAVTDERGQRVENGPVRLEPGDRTQLSVGLPSLAPGEYRVTWRVTADTDQDYNEGFFTFAVFAEPGAGLLDRLRGAGLLALAIGLLAFGVAREAGRAE